MTRSRQDEGYTTLALPSSGKGLNTRNLEMAYCFTIRSAKTEKQIRVTLQDCGWAGKAGLDLNSSSLTYQRRGLACLVPRTGLTVTPTPGCGRTPGANRREVLGAQEELGVCELSSALVLACQGLCDSFDFP